MRLFLSASHPAVVLERGLYAGLKSRGGLPSPLPVTLGPEIYVNAGFIDGLSPHLVQSLELQGVKLRLIFSGALLVQWYFLERHGTIRHFADENLAFDETISISTVDLDIPSVLLNVDNVASVFFRLCHSDRYANLSSSQLVDWCFHAENTIGSAQKPLLMVSRSHGESINLVEQHYALYIELVGLKKRFPDLHFMPMPCLYLYESEMNAYDKSKKQLSKYRNLNSEFHQALKLQKNPLNLGGGGNMCFAVKSSIADSSNSQNLAMIDSDTIVPFKTFYTTALISEFSRNKQDSSGLISPVVAYRKSPRKVLEAGALFGRGAWDLLSPQPLQPCILPLHHGADLSDRHVQAGLSTEINSDYAPFIYNLFCPSSRMSPTSLLPAPFFLRGDDIEYGTHLRNNGISVTVCSDLLVFQDPKHSLWHEAMAVLHSTVILVAYDKMNDLSKLSENLYKYYEARLYAHSSIRDLLGISVYQYVLTRLLSILEVPAEDLLTHFYSTEFYQRIQSLNASYTRSNYIMIQEIQRSNSQHSCLLLPFLYFPHHSNDRPLPDTIILLNHLAETAAIHYPAEVTDYDLQKAVQQFKYDLSRIVGNLNKLQPLCKCLLDRNSIAALLNQIYSKAT